MLLKFFTQVPVVFFPGVAVSNLTWRVLHGCFHREARNGCLKASGSLFVVLSRSLVVPCAWLFVTFMDGR